MKRAERINTKKAVEDNLLKKDDLKVIYEIFCYSLKKYNNLPSQLILLLQGCHVLPICDDLGLH